MEALRKTQDGALLLSLHVQPGARRTEFAGLHGEAVKIRLAAPPVDGKANACLQAFLADFMDLPKRSIVLVNGETSRTKLLRIEDASETAIVRLCEACGAKL